MNTETIVGLIMAFLAGGCVLFAYDAGGKKVRSEYEQEQNKATAHAKKIRSSLSDDNVVGRLHKRFKR